MSGQVSKIAPMWPRTVLALGGLAGGVVVEDHVRRVHRHDRVEVVGVPGLVVAVDRVGERPGESLSLIEESNMVTGGSGNRDGGSN